MIHTLDDSTEAPPIPNSYRGHRGVGLIIHLLLPYQTIAAHSSLTIQSLTIRGSATTTTIICIDPKARGAQEASVLQKINEVSVQRATRMGDMNDRLKTWDNTNNPRGARVGRWATRTG